MLMRKKINSRLYMTYMIITLVFSISLVAAFYALNATTVRENSEHNLNQTNQTVLNQVDTHIKLLDTISTDIVSNTEFLFNLRNMFTANQQSNNNNSRQGSHEALKRISIEALVGQYDIYRISIITPEGDFISTGETSLDAKSISAYVSSNEWYDHPAAIEGRKFLISPHIDNWLPESKQSVISLVRAIYLNDEIVGFLEIQQKLEVIQTILSPEIDGYALRTILIEDNGSIFYDSEPSNSETDIYGKVRDLFSHYRRQTVEYDTGLLNMGLSRYFDWQLALHVPTSIIYKSYRFLFMVNLTVSLLITAVSVLFFSYFIRRITRPILKLVQDFENTNIDNLHKPNFQESNSYEANVLAKSFTEMVSRLSESIEERHKLQDLQIQASFDALQSQIGPHFLYNTLGSIANMCENSEAVNAANACYDLTDILRYSANFKNPIVTLNNEIEMLKSYLYLMKTRYQHRLDYSFLIEVSSNDVRIPRLTLQPLVENAIKYSLLEQEVVTILIKINESPNSLIISIEDNGRGISEEETEGIRRRVMDLYNNSQNDKSDIIAVGGAGLIGTIVRLKIFYGSDFRYESSTSNTGGAKIELSIPWGKK